MREAQITRKTGETDIALTLNLDGAGRYENQTGCGFLGHMLDLFAKHGGFDLTVRCQGDTHVDYHHTVEDIGIALGQAVRNCLGDMVGVNRYGHIILPMDEVLMLCAADFCGRAYLGFDVAFQTEKIGDFDTELVQEFFLGFTRAASCTLHFQALSDGNAHHTAEAMFKAFGRTLRMASAYDETRRDQLMSTKGMIE